jgi:hypothetical protein
MSLGAFLCQCCQEVCEDCESCICQGCEMESCDDCEANGRFETFVFDGEEWCNFCFQTKPDEITDSDLLQIAITKLGTTKKRLREELLVSGPDRFRVAPHEYACTICPESECSSSLCEQVSKGIGEECVRRFGYFEMDSATKGYCCKARHEANACLGCKGWEARRLARTLIGIRKKRKDTLLAWLPRDVLVMCIIKPFIVK